MAEAKKRQVVRGPRLPVCLVAMGELTNDTKDPWVVDKKADGLKNFASTYLAIIGHRT